MVYFTDMREHAIQLFIDADILPVTVMYYKTVASLVHDINNNNNSPPNLLNLVEKTSTIHSSNTRSSTSGNFHVKSSMLGIHVHKNSLSRFGVINFGMRYLVILEIFLKKNLRMFFTDCFPIS